MKLYEYESKEVFARYGVKTPRGVVVFHPEDVLKAIEGLGLPAVLKAQVLVGGRGKAGGIVKVSSFEEALIEANRMFKMKIKGEDVKAVLVEEAVNILRELYFSITIDRFNRSYLILSSIEGGVDIEEVASRSPEKIVRKLIDPLRGLRDYDVRSIVKKLNIPQGLQQLFIDTAKNLYKIFIDYSADLVEVNPLVVTVDERLLALDAKTIVDDNALFKLPELSGKTKDLRDLSEIEFKARRLGLNYVELEGDIGIIGNGAGLTMATMDLVYFYGGKPANFLDVGGGARSEIFRDGVKLILEHPRVKALFINIFGGITRCDEVAKGIVEGVKSVKVNKPIAVRLVGTNEEEGRRILSEHGVNCFTDADEAAKHVIEILRSG
jgi:succinyl-CoA synthetase beta subunit